MSTISKTFIKPPETIYNQCKHIYRSYKTISNDIRVHVGPSGPILWVARCEKQNVEKVKIIISDVQGISRRNVGSTGGASKVEPLR